MVFFYCGIVSVRLLLEINLTPIEKFMPSSIRFILTNKVIELINKCTAMVTDGSFDEVTLPFEVPSEPGVYEYSFQPYMVRPIPLLVKKSVFLQVNRSVSRSWLGKMGVWKSGTSRLFW